jgi:hypothetical protein
VRVYSPIGFLPDVIKTQLKDLGSFTGKKLLILENGKANARQVMTAVADLLEERHGPLQVRVERKESPSLPADPALVADMASEADVVLTGSGD